MIRFLRDAAQCADCVPIEITARGLVVEVGTGAVKMLEDEISGVLAPRGAEIARITNTQI